MKKFGLTLVVVLLCGFVTTPALAQVMDKTFKDWTVYTTNLQGKKACYRASFPSSKTGNYKKRDEPYFLVTRISNDVFEVSSSSGFEYKKSSDVKVSIDGEKFDMFTKFTLEGFRKPNRL